MKFTALTIATLASLTAALSGPQLRFAEYDKKDMKCNPDNLISPSISVPSQKNKVGDCIAFPPHTYSVGYVLLDGSQTGCTVRLYTKSGCKGKPAATFVPKVNEKVCKPPPRNTKGWTYVKVSCPKA